MRESFSQPRRRADAAGNRFRAAFLMAALFAGASFVSGCASIANSSSVPAAALSVVPAAIDFKTVVVGQKNSQALTITNTSTGPIDINAMHVSGATFSLAPAKLPLVLAPGAKSALSVVFVPASAAAVDGSLALYSPDFKGTLNVPLSGAGEKAAAALQVAPASVSFGTRATSSSSFQTVNLKNTGNVALKINSASASNAIFSISGISAGVSVAPGQQLSFQVWFRPATSGNWTGTISIASPSLSSPVKLTLSGAASSTAVSAPSSIASHSVSLDWLASSSSVAGYHVYRSNVSGGPYSRITGSLVEGISFKDASVLSGSQYFYVVTAVESTGAESDFSNQVSADIPD